MANISTEQVNDILNLREASQNADVHSSFDLWLASGLITAAVFLREVPVVVFAIPAASLFVDSVIRGRRAKKLEELYFKTRRDALLGKTKLSLENSDSH